MIPREKITDVMFGKPKAYEGIKHNHDKIPTPLELKQCQRCRFDVAEQSLVEKIKILKPTQKTKYVQNKIAKTATFQSLAVIRGRLDDVIGWTIEWS